MTATFWPSRVSTEARRCPRGHLDVPGGTHLPHAGGAFGGRWSLRLRLGLNRPASATTDVPSRPEQASSAIVMSWSLRHAVVSNGRPSPVARRDPFMFGERWAGRGGPAGRLTRPCPSGRDRPGDAGRRRLVRL